MSITPHIQTLPQAPHRPVKAIYCYLAYFLAIAGGAVSWFYLRQSQAHLDPFITGLVITIIATFVVYVFSIANNNSSIYDPYWVIAPPLLALGIKATSEAGLTAWHPRDILVMFCLCYWAARYHLFYSWEGWSTGLTIEDWRYEDMRDFPVVPYWLNSLIGMHYFPTLLVYFAFAPAALVLMTTPADQAALSWFDLLALVGAISAATIQYFADKQCADYRSSKDYEAGGAIQSGLWRYSRHPNYFGEVLFWLSMMPFAYAAGLFDDHRTLIVAGPIAMALFFRFSSWLMDVRSLKRRPNYQAVIDQTSAMWPWFPKSQA